MTRLLPIFASMLLAGCGAFDRMAKDGMLPPGDRILVGRIANPGMMQPDPPCEFPVLPPSPDWNGDGGVDGADVESFLGDWCDGAADVNWDGVCDGCDLVIWFGAWEQGG